MKIVMLSLVLMTLSSIGFGQNNKLVKKVYKSQLVKIPKTEPEIMSKINELKFDSVKVFSFGCKILRFQPAGLLYMNQPDGYLLSQGLVDSTQHWIPLLSSTGEIISAIDVDNMLTALKNYNKDLYRNEASGCFEPYMGIVFYKDGIVNAHIDVCLTCNRIHFEIVKEARVFYKFNLAPLGDNLEKVFESFIPKYRLITCD